MSAMGPAGTRPHRRILASAGTGKTHALVGRYLQLIAQGADPASVLATTFTRAAAAEIRDRMLRAAATAVIDEQQRAELAMRTTGKGGLDQAKANQLLERLVVAMPRLQVRTLDSLFAGIVRGFGEVVGLSPDAKLLESGEDEVVLREAIELAIAQEPDRVLDTLEALGRTGNSSRVISTVQRAVSSVLELSLRATDEAWNWPKPSGPSKDSLLTARSALLNASESVGDKRVVKAIAALADTLGEELEVDGETWKELMSSKFIATSTGDGRYYGKELPGEVREPLACIAEAVIAGNARNLANRTGAIHDLVDMVAPALEAHKRRLGVVTFHDLVRALDPDRLKDSADLMELWFRLDGRITHVLLDEFQDTSTSQWRAMQEIISEITAFSDGSRSLLAVGDLKQSIYGWRGGEPAILERLEKACGHGSVELSEEVLEKSWRSGEAIIETVNAVFCGIESNPAVHSVSSPAAESFGTWFRTHETARSELGGESRLEFLPVATDEDSASAILVRHAAEAAAELVERHGLVDAGGRPTVAVLVRRNRVIAGIVEALRARGIPASGRGGGSLLDADACIVVLQALRWAASPLDSIAAYDVARSPLGPVLGLEACAEGEGVASTLRERISGELREAIDRDGAAHLVDGWRRVLEPKLDTRERIRLRQLVEFLDELGRSPRDPGELAELARHARVEDPGADGVVVMNVHQAKGLEFNAVVVTDMEQQLGPNQEPLAWETPPLPAGDIQRICTWYAQDARPEEAQRAHLDTTARIVGEKLCGLYVAITRPRMDLVMQVPPPARTGNGKEGRKSLASMAGVLRHALVPEVDDPEASRRNVTVVWKAGHPAGDGGGELSAPLQRRRPSVALAQGKRRLRATTIGAPSRKEGFSSEVFRIDRESDTDRGRAIHACFQEVGWFQESQPGRELLLGVISRACPRRDREWIEARYAEFQRYLQLPAVEEALKGPSGQAWLRREAGLLRRGANGVQLAVIDRLVLFQGDSGVIDSAEVIDFKTDRPSSPSLFVSRHAGQLREYADFVASAYRILPSSVRMKLVELETGMTHEVPAKVSG